MAWSWTLLLLVPVVLLEAGVLRLKLGVAMKQLLPVVGFANGATTILGHLAAWFIAVFGVAAIWQASSDPYAKDAGPVWRGLGLLIGNFIEDQKSLGYWMDVVVLYGALLVAFLPFFVVSWLVEALLAGWALDLGFRRVNTAMILANIVSYLFLFSTLALCVASESNVPFSFTSVLQMWIDNILTVVARSLGA